MKIVFFFSFQMVTFLALGGQIVFLNKMVAIKYQHDKLRIKIL